MSEILFPDMWLTIRYVYYVGPIAISFLILSPQVVFITAGYKLNVIVHNQCGLQTVLAFQAFGSKRDCVKCA